jgi:SAM-dependent methyltransferase
VTVETTFRLVDGVKCYHPEVAESYDSYPENGFEVTDDVEAESFWVRSRTRLLKSEVSRACGGSGARMLEVGCGTGVFLRSLAGTPGLELLGSKIYLRGLESARARGGAIEFIQLDATRIPFQSEFDIVGAFDVIEHIDDDAAVLRGVCRSLKPGGQLLLTVPQHPFLWSRLDELVHHKRRYTRDGLVRKVQEAGLYVSYASSFLFTCFPLMLISRLFDRGGGPDAKGEFDRRVRFSPLVNAVLDALMRIDEWLIRRRFSLPWGGSLLLVARKP